MAAPLAPGRFLFSSEAVTEGNPDKLCDRVADAVLDACLSQDVDCKVACDACTKAGMVMILGEVVTKASVNFEQVMREAVKAVGYDSEDKGLDWRTVNIIVAVEEQAPDLATALSGTKAPEEVGLGSLGSAFGYATDEAADFLPVSQTLASQLCAKLDSARKEGALGWLRPDARVQVTVEYQDTDGAAVPKRISAVSIAARRSVDVTDDKAEKELLEQVVKPNLPASLVDANTQYQVSIRQQSQVDSGLSGRKSSVDLYGGWVSSGTTALSGKDGSKLARSATYGARWAARSLVASGLCRRCAVELGYGPKATQPLSVRVNSYGTSKKSGKSDGDLAELISKNFDFRPGCLQRDLHLKSAQFQRLAAYGHVGRDDLDLPWERAKELK